MLYTHRDFKNKSCNHIQLSINIITERGKAKAIQLANVIPESAPADCSL